MILTKEFRFEASHILKHHPGKCSRLHGHSWVFTIAVEGPVDSKTGFVVDFYDIGKVGHAIEELLDHRHLGGWSTDMPYNSDWAVRDNDDEFNSHGLYPTSENLLFWMACFIGTTLPWCWLSIKETCTSSATLTREEYDAVTNSRNIPQH